MELANQVIGHRFHKGIVRDGDLAVLLTDLDLGAALLDAEPIPAVDWLALYGSNEIAIDIPLAFHDGLLLRSRQRPRSPDAPVCPPPNMYAAFLLFQRIRLAVKRYPQLRIRL